MKTGCYRLAGHTVELRTRFAAVHAMCRAFKAPADAAPEYTIETTAEDVAFERARSPEPYGDAYLETLAVYRKLAQTLLRDDVLLFHASAIAVDGAGYLFTAPSGTGKSTHARLWRELLGDRAVMVNDDKPLLHITERGVTVYGTPWSGKHDLHADLCVPVRAICVLHQAPENTIAPITPLQALPMLLQQSYRPQEQAALEHTVRLLERLSDRVRLFSMGCTPDIEAARIAYAALSESK